MTLTPEEFITEKGHRYGDAQLARMEKAYRRALKWMQANLGSKRLPPAHIKRAMDEMRALEELTASSRDRDAMEEWQRNQDPTAVPPPPVGGKVELPRRGSVAMLAAVDAKRRKEG